ncbi:MAG: hypothetical protein NT023_13020 [Armatimonadetes bacterium]|nr:hypothetical protein [Armatimonadota bacterium]
MKTLKTLLLLVLLAVCANCSFAQIAVALPPGVKANWNLALAYREATPLRERVCINGLWHWQPASKDAPRPPEGNWGYFKTPGCWTGITDYMQKDCQTVFAHPSWKGTNLAGVTAAWYQREIAIPTGWKGRRIALSADSLNSYAVAYIDGRRVGDLHFPAGELDLSSACAAGRKYTLSLYVVALPLKSVMLSYIDTSHATEVRGEVARRGLCGDVFLVSSSPLARLSDIKIDTSVQKGEITVDTGLQGLQAGKRYTLHADITDSGRKIKEFTGSAFQSSDLKAGRIAFATKWKPEKLWDLNTPQYQYHATVSLREESGGTLDVSYPARFGFREFYIKGKDFYLNGSRIYLSAVPLDNAQVSAALSTYEGAKESMKRLQSFGINFVYTHNYDCEPGSHLSFSEILRAADDVGMLVAMTQPHFSHYDWKALDAEKSNNYARHAEYYVRVSQNHPSVVAYSMSHNATGYEEDMNPDMIDGIQGERDQWASRNANMALRAEAIVKRFDPNKIVYHHAGGNIGAIHSSNFYPNFVPIQELSDWFGHWSKEGVKPAFLCEFGAPFTWDWTMYRGWYQGKREWGSAAVPWEYCLAEWNAQFLGEKAYEITEMEKTNLRWEAKQFREGKVWHRWDYPYQVGSKGFDDEHTVIARYITDNWRAFRTWGVSGISPWEHDHFWKLKEGVDRSRKELPVDWENLQRPGFSPDYLGEQYERFDLAYKSDDWVPTAEGRALLANNMPVLAYIGGKSAKFTSKDHNFYAGEKVEKQLILINNSRQSQVIQCTGTLIMTDANIRILKIEIGQRLPERFARESGGLTTVELGAGEQIRLPIRFSIPSNANVMTVGIIQDRRGEFFGFHVLPKPTPIKTTAKIALFDPKGETRALLAGLKTPFQSVQATDDLSRYDVLVIGKGAMTLGGGAPDIRRVRQGLKVVLFEQSAEVLEKRFGFRVQEYGLRQVFPRIPDHPLLKGLRAENLQDWRGEATNTPSRLNYTMRPMHGPTVQRNGIDVSRVWRGGNQGNVASVLIEKPARGDFRPIADGGYSLQYSPLMEFREGRGLVIFCQMDVSGRTESDPAGEILAHNILSYVSSWKPTPVREALYVGEAAGKAYLEASGVRLRAYQGGNIAQSQALIVAQGGGEILAQNKTALSAWLTGGGHLLALGLDEANANAFLPFTLHTKRAEHIGGYFDAAGANSLFAGVSPADVHNRDPRELSLITEGAAKIGGGVLAASGNVLFCQLVPWEFDNVKQMNVKRTYRHLNVLVSRLLGNMGIAESTPLLDRFSTPAAKTEKRWLEGFYRDIPEEWDDPYCFFRW